MPGFGPSYMLGQSHNDPIWRELEDTLLAHGVRTYSIYLDPHRQPVRLWHVTRFPVRRRRRAER